MAGELSPADVIELVQVNTRYAYALDLGQPELFSDVFTEDMLLEFHPLENAPSIRYEGLRSFLDRPPARFRSQHFLSNHEFAADANCASGISYVQGQHWLEENPADLYLIGARYQDRYRRVPRGWRIAERHCYYMWAEGNPAVLTGQT